MALGSKYTQHVFQTHFHLKFNPNEAMIKSKHLSKPNWIGLSGGGETAKSGL